MYHDGNANPLQMQYMQLQGPGYWPGPSVPNHNQEHLQTTAQMYMQPSPQGMDSTPMIRRMMTFPTMAYNPNTMVPGLAMARSSSPSNQANRVMTGGSIYGVPAPMNVMQPQAHAIPHHHAQRSVSESGPISGHVGMENSFAGREGFHSSHHSALSNDAVRGYPHPSYRPMYNDDSRSGAGSSQSPLQPYPRYPNDSRSRYPSHGDRNRRSFETSNGVPTVIRDSLLDEFRNTYGKTRQWTLQDLAGHTSAFCQDQHGSRFIQQRLEISSREDRQFLFEEILPSANSLMTDVFGNYVLQKLFEFGNEKQCDALASLLTNQCVPLSMHMYGCRVIQKALEYVNPSRLQALVSEFETPSTLINCVYDANGNHVIQKTIEVVSKVARDTSADREIQESLIRHLQFVVDSFRHKVKELSTHPYGCRVIQRVLEHGLGPMKASIMGELKLSSDELIQDCYGNYVIQFVMQYGQDHERSLFFKTVLDHLIEYSQHKFASNVVEKCLQHSPKRDRDELIWKVINVTFDTNSPIDGRGNSALEAMVRDPYANYVVQKVIDVSDEKQRAAILKYVRENIMQLRRYTYGKHIVMRLEKLTNEKF